MEEKDRTIQLMQVQMMKYERVSDDSGENCEPADMCNAATQTERIRPVSAGPSILHSLPSDSNGSPLVRFVLFSFRVMREPVNLLSSSNTMSNKKLPILPMQLSDWEGRVCGLFFGCLSA